MTYNPDPVIAPDPPDADDEQAKIKSDAIELAGSEETLNGWLASAKALGKERIEDLNRRLVNPSLYKGALAEIKAEYDATPESKVKPLVNGTLTSGGSGMARDKKEYLSLVDAASKGDKAAQARLKATPVERVMQWG